MGVLRSVAVLVCAGFLMAETGRAATRGVRAPAVLSAWDRAERGRAQLEAKAEGPRSRAEFARVLDEYRAIYHDNPADAHAPRAVNAVAELLAEQGREFEDEKSLRAAVGQYEFLRTQYPGSALRGPALLAEARLQAEDLGELGVARGSLRRLVREEPRSEAGRDAKRRLDELDTKAPRAVLARERKAGSSAAPRNDKDKEAGSSAAPRNDKEKEAGFSAAPRNDKEASSAASRNDRGLGLAALGEKAAGASARSGVLPQVTGIRHWSTPTYTRVAIDLGGEVTFEAARVPNPDRIYFDLHGAKLGAELVGKSFDVTDDGFLKRIRAAQAGGDVTRVVLDVNDVTEYSAFLLPNPYRLIIDIHGGKALAAGGPLPPGKTELAAVPVAAGAVREASAAANTSGLPPTAPTDGGDAVRAAEGLRQPNAAVAGGAKVGLVPRPSTAKPVPNTVAVAKEGTTREVAAVSETPGRVDATDAPTSKPIATTVPALKPVTPGNGRKMRGKDADAEPVRAAEKTADGETSLVRALGLKINRIVIDAGHGGHDSGTLGVDGIQEKDVVLDVALRLGRLLHERLGAEIIYTRSDDTFIPLETRTAIANKAQADLFLSIHANSSRDETARGVETYYLNFTSDASALDVAARENAAGGQSIHQLSDLVKKITLKDKIAESREFAADVEGSLYAGLEKGNAGLKNRGVKKAPFVVLIGANMPSILAEISFVTNARDAAQLRDPEYRERVAESLYAGVARYEGGLAGPKTPVVKRAALQ